MGSGSSQLQSEHPYFQSTRSLHSNTHPTPVGRPADNKSSIIKLEKTKKDILAKEEKHIQEHNGFTPFTPRGTIGYSSNPKHAGKQGSRSGTKKKGKRSSGVSFHARNVYISDEDDGEFDDEELDRGLEHLTGKEKIESHLRRCRVPETKVRGLAVIIWEEALNELQQQQLQAQRDTKAMCATLRNTIHQPLDLMLYGKSHRTTLKKVEENVEELVHKVSEMVELLEVDMALCLDSVERHVAGKKGAKSVPLLVRDAMLGLEADYDILHDKYHDLRREKEEAISLQTKTQTKSEALEETSVQLEKEFKRLIEQNRDMGDFIQELKDHRRQLRNSHNQLTEDNARLKKQVQWYQESNAIVHKDLMKLKETCTQLQVQSTQQVKEIRRLKDPDKDMLYKIQRLETELTEAKTANRRLELEKGTVKSSLQKVQAHYDSLQRERGTLVKQRQKLQKENDKIKTTNKKLTLSK